MDRDEGGLMTSFAFIAIVHKTKSSVTQGIQEGMGCMDARTETFKKRYIRI